MAPVYDLRAVVERAAANRPMSGDDNANSCASPLSKDGVRRTVIDMRRRVVLVFTSMVAVVGFGFVATPADAHQDVAWPCGAVLDGTLGHRGVEKVASVVDAPDGRATVNVNLTTTEAIRETLVVECSWIDLDADGARDTNEAVSFHLQPVRFSGQAKRMGSFQLTLEHSAGARICDKVAVLGLQPSHDLVQLRSNTACGQARAPVVPEVDAVPLLGVSALVAGGAVLWLRRRRSLAR
jgi:hypothetical protein